jgi:hypothetical protein
MIQDGVGIHHARFGQSIFDVCLQTYGIMRHLYKLIQDNGLSSAQEQIIQGRQFIFDLSLVNDISLLNYNESGNIFYITSNSTIETDNSLLNIELEEDGTPSLEEDGSVSLRE